MTEPSYIRQTAEREHVSREGRQQWIRNAWDAALAEGCSHGRVTISNDETMLLMEGWTERPADEGAPRWSLQATEPRP